MAQHKILDEKPENGDFWLADYPSEHAAVLKKYGVAPWMHDQADLHNRAVMAAAASGAANAQLADMAEKSFQDRFGTTLIAAAAANHHSATGGPAVPHVSLGAEHQVSVANSITHVMQRYSKGEVAAWSGFTIDARGGVRLFGGGVADPRVLAAARKVLSAAVDSGSEDTDDLDYPPQVHQAQLKPKLWRNENWAVTEAGLSSLVTAGDPPRLVEYEIEASRLLAQDPAKPGVSMWAMQVARKSWVTDIDEAIEAISMAIELHHPGQNVIDMDKTSDEARAEWARTHR